MTMHGCTFQLWQGGTFIRQAAYQVLDNSVSWLQGEGATGGQDYHSHGLTDGYANMAGYGAGWVRYQEKTLGYNVSKSYNIDCNSGSYGTTNDPYACALGGSTNTTSNVPSYNVAWLWKRTA